MATNFIVILFQRQHFGNEQGTFSDIEATVPFVGPTKDFSFNCPNVDPDETAFLTFQSRDVDHQRNIFQINGVDVFGGLPVSPDRNTWNGNILLVEPRHQLSATGNVLHIESRNSSGGIGGNIDDFIIDNVVIVYKTRTAGVVSAVAPYIDLREAPFSVVANDSSPAVVAQNTAGINLAIATYSGTGANLVLPNGDIFVEEQAPGGAEIRWCIKFGTGVSKLTLSGQGMFATTLVQLCVGDFGELNLLNIDGASYIDLANLGFRQDRITNPDPAQQNHLVAVYNNALGGTTEHIRGRNLFFGKCIGDAIRILANDPSDHVVDAKFSNFLMVLNGVVTSVPPNGRTGARSGIAIQRGGTDCEFGNFYIVGAQNSAIDEEPSGGASVRTYFHDFQIDNSLGNTGTPVSLGGSGGGDIAYDGRIHDGYIKGGNLTMLGPTSGYKLERLTIETTAPPVAGATSLLLIRSGSGGHTDLELNDITIKRTGTSADGNCLDIINTGNRTTIRNLHVVQGVAGSPVAIDGATRLNLEGYRLQYQGASPGSHHGVLVQAINSDADDIRISDVNIVSSTGKLQAAVHLDQRNPRSMVRIKISDVRSAASASHGVYMSFDTTGGTLDRSPEISGIANGSDPVWTQKDQNDNPISTVFPIISGNRGDICTFVGEATPEGVVTAIQGCMCVRKNGDTTELFFKKTTTGNTGWVQITVP